MTWAVVTCIHPYAGFGAFLVRSKLVLVWFMSGSPELGGRTW